MLKFGQREVTAKDFYGQRQITNLFTINVNRVVYLIRYHKTMEKTVVILQAIKPIPLIPLFIKTPKDIFSSGVSQYDKNSTYTMSFNFSEEKAWKTQYKKIWNEVEAQLFEKMATELIKREDRYVNGKLKTWKERVKVNFHGQDVPYNMHCSAAAVLKIDSMYKQDKKLSLKSANTLMQKTNNAAC